LGIAILEPSLPLWMMESWSGKEFYIKNFFNLFFKATSFERGAAFLVSKEFF